MPLQGRALRNLNSTTPARRILGTAFVGLLGAAILANPPGPDGASILARQDLDPAARYRLVWGESTFASAWVEETGAARLSVPGAAVFTLFENGLPVAAPQELRTVTVSPSGEFVPAGGGGSWGPVERRRAKAPSRRASDRPAQREAAPRSAGGPMAADWGDGRPFVLAPSPAAKAPKPAAPEPTRASLAQAPAFALLAELATELHAARASLAGILTFTVPPPALQTLPDDAHAVTTIALALTLADQHNTAAPT